MVVHKLAAARKRRRSARKPGPVVITRVPPEALREALRLGGGPSGIRIVSAREVHIR
jgi:hypothetical protein